MAKRKAVYPYQPPGGRFDDSQFFKEPFIKDIAGKKRWTLSDCQLKMPLDTPAILEKGKIYGASLKDGNWPYVDLPTLQKCFPLATNATYLLDASIDCKAILDIEPDCPEGLRRELLNLPFEYAEVSMSLKGLHLGFTLRPEDIAYFGERVALKDKDRYFEVLLRHHITFSKRLLNLQPPKNPKPLMPFLKALHDSMPKPLKIDVQELPEEPSTTRYQQMLTVLAIHEFGKGLDDFGGDHSDFEMAMASSAWYRLEQSFAKNQKADTENYQWEAAWAIYQYLKLRLNPREKHKETRIGMPWLLYIATYSIKRCIAREQERAGEALGMAAQDLSKAGKPPEGGSPFV